MDAPSPQETWDQLFGDYYLRASGATADDAAAAQAQAAATLTGCPEGGELLDVPCGFGRHAVPLAAAGYRVTGVDRSEPLLEEARRRSGGAEFPRLVDADYRELPFADESFDGALNLSSSLGYLGDEEDTKVLAEVARVLRPGTRLVIETVHRDLLVHRYQERDWRMVGAGRMLLEQRTFDPAAGVALTTQTLIAGDGGRESRTFSLRVYSATELVTMLRRAGFAKAQCFGGLDGAPLQLGTRLVVVAIKAAQ